MESDQLYNHLQSFTDFNQLVDSDHYELVPEDWVVFVTDVVGSTQAIQQGRYKEVNTMGAATIASVQNTLKGFNFPFVFGGDGASLIVPQKYSAQVANELISLKATAQKEFDLELRVASMKVQEVHELGSVIEVAKFELVHEQSIAVFRGGGLSLVDQRVKQTPEKYSVQIQSQDKPASLQGLSCRWQPIKTQKGEIVSLLIEANSPNLTKTYTEVIHHLEKILGRSLEEANPVNLETTKYHSFFENLKSELKTKSHLKKGWIQCVIELAVCTWSFSLNLVNPFFESKKYKKSIRNHSDFRKFDDMLRLVLDCSELQKKQIISFLEECYFDGEIYYGLHSSEHALMTCYVPSTKEGGHIHFIDGDNGGYAMAAKQLKSQKNLASQKSYLAA